MDASKLIEDDEVVIRLVVAHLWNRAADQDANAVYIPDRWTVRTKNEVYIWCKKADLGAEYNTVSLINRLENYQLDPNYEMTLITESEYGWTGNTAPEGTRYFYGELQRIVRSLYQYPMENEEEGSENYKKFVKEQLQKRVSHQNKTGDKDNV